MGSGQVKGKRIREIVDKSQYWDVDDLIRNFDREMSQLEQGLGHMIWDLDQHRVTTCLLPLPVAPSFDVNEDEKEFKLKVKLPGVSRDELRLRVEKDSVEVFACVGDTSCKPYYLSVVAKGELDPESADAKLSGSTFEVRVQKAKKKRLKIR